MKAHLGILLTSLLFLSSCVNTAPSSDGFEYPELKHAFLESIILSGWSGKDIYVYEEFSNEDYCELVNIVYQSFNVDINYELNDSIVNLLETREDRKISKRLIDEPGVNIHLIKDTTSYHNYIVFSEPISIDNKWMIFSISKKDSANKKREHYVHFIKKGNEGSQFTTPYFYNWQKDYLLEGKVIK